MQPRIRHATLLLATAAAFAACRGEPRSDPPDTAGAAPDEATPATAPAEGADAAPLIEIELINREGQRIGTAQISEEGEGVRIAVQASNLPPGRRGFHLHQTGRCDPPDFQTAGGHFAPFSRQHGLENPEGPHAGDMQNLEVADDGTANATVDNPRVTLRPGLPNSLLDDDGTALIIHAQEDDQRTDPTGNAGDRIACGVIRGG